MDLGELRRWIGTTRRSRDVITPRVANALAAVLDDDPTLEPGDAAPLGVHWYLSPDIAPMSRLGSDGHPARGDFLPPVRLPRRMWAGGKLDLRGAFRVGDEVERTSRIDDVRVKQGSTGILCFVAVRHDYATARGVELIERQDIVYRDIDTIGPRPASREPDPAPDMSATVRASPVLLMRYSAATFNATASTMIAIIA